MIPNGREKYGSFVRSSIKRWKVQKEPVRDEEFNN